MSYPAGSLDMNKIMDAIFGWVYLVLGDNLSQSQIIWRNQSEPLPSRPCVTLKIIDGPRPVARDANVQEYSPNGFYSIGMQMEMTVSVQVFGTTLNAPITAMQLALDLNSSLLRKSVLDVLNKGGVAVQGLGQIRNLSALEESQYEERSGFEISCGLVQNISDQPGIIAVVNGEIETDVKDDPFHATLP